MTVGLQYSPRLKSVGIMNKASNDSMIANNRRATHDYFIEERLEAGLVLQGWEVKSLRAQRVNLAESYVSLKTGEAWLVGAHISALKTVCTHHSADPTRARKLLLNRREINKLIGRIQREGVTVVPLRLYWARGCAKLEIGLARGKKQHDKRTTQKNKDWQRQRERLLKTTTR